MSCKLKLGWFATSRGQTSLKIFNYIYNAIKNNELNAEIQFVFLNRQLGEAENSDRFINEVEKLNIPVITFSSKKFLPEVRKTDIELWREKFDKEVYNLICKFNVDIIMLAGYMLILSKFLCQKFTVINLHPALPWGPKGTWQEVINTIIKEKHQEHGVMIHIVTEDLDRGPVITYCRFKIEEYDFDKIRQQGVQYELPLVKKTLCLIADNEIKIIDRKVYDKNNRLLPQGLEIKLAELTAFL